MNRRLLSLLLCLAMLVSACALCFTGCAPAEEEEEEEEVDLATTLVMWCVTEEGTDDEQAQAVAKAMSEKTQSEFKTKLIVKYMTMEEYYENLEAAMEQLEADKIAKEEAEKKAKEEAKKNKNNKDKDKKDEEEKKEEKEEKPKKDKTEDDDEIKYDADGNPIIDTTVYPEVSDYQVDILYLSGYDKYSEYIAKEWLTKLDQQLSGESKQIANYVPGALLNAVKYNGSTYAIPNNNVIGEYTYMLIDRELYDKYYYTAEAEDVHSVVDLASFLEDVAKYEDDILPINGDVNYCMGLIANYWDVDPETMKVTGDFSVMGYAYKDTDKINRGNIVLRFDSLLTDPTYRNALTNLMDFQFLGYFGTAAEGQKSAVSFVKGDAASATEYEDDYYVVVVDYPRAADEDIYANMFAVSAFTSDVKKSMQVVTYMNTDAAFRNLFQYGIDGINYTLNDDGTVHTTRTNGYHMDLAKTGNEFIAHVPAGTNLKVWEYAKQQNREALVNPLLGFDFAFELNDDSEILAKAEDDVLEEDEELLDEYVIETLDKELLTYISELSDSVWARIQACENTEELETLLDQLALELAIASDENVKRSTVYEITEAEYDLEGKVKVDDKGNPTVENPTVKIDCKVKLRKVMKDVDGIEEEVEEFYFVKTKHLTPFQVYYRWLSDYGFMPK
ncbi:MAG: hypothetical protein J6R04_08090 [Clostridia bacterium]|nr:hypothetical protein [Clostridia bacterium]